MNCLSCDALNGKNRISPGPTIYSGRYWQIEHAYPTKLLGWIVLVYKTHITSLHEIPKEAMLEKADLEYKCILFFNEQMKSIKEYTACFAEAPGFEHIHEHLIPKLSTHPVDAAGSKVFTLLKVSREEAVNSDLVIDFCKNMAKFFGP